LDGGHLAALDGLGHITQFAGAFAPVREVESSTSFNNIHGDQPGAGGDITVPGPFSFVAMTLETMLLGNLACSRAVPFGFLDDRRVGAVMAERDHLQQNKNDHSGDYEIFQNFLHVFLFWKYYIYKWIVHPNRFAREMSNFCIVRKFLHKSVAQASSSVHPCGRPSVDERGYPVDKTGFVEKKYQYFVS